MRFTRYVKDENGNIVSMNLKPIEWQVYRYLEQKAKEDCNLWVTKEELLTQFPQLEKGKTNHDECAELNVIRIHLLEALKRNMISHAVLVKSNTFKIATNESELNSQIDKELEKGIKHFIRAYVMKNKLRLDGQGKFIDCNGKVIDEKSLAKKFNNLFEV